VRSGAKHKSCVGPRRALPRGNRRPPAPGSGTLALGCLRGEEMNERILIIDDEPSIHEVARAYLEREGFIVYSATDGRQGLELAMSKRPQLVVLDLMLPDISGEEICRQLRERSDVALLMLTAKSSEDQRVEGLQLGADDYITKPEVTDSWRG
jgi:CheY-like chemotaxis protein